MLFHDGIGFFPFKNCTWVLELNVLDVGTRELPVCRVCKLFGWFGGSLLALPSNFHSV